MRRELFVQRSLIPASAAEVFAWHQRPGAFQRLAPPWQRVELLRHDGIRDGDRAIIKTAIGPINKKWTIEHFGFIDGEQFCDRQLSGPFAAWQHTHYIEPVGERACMLEDRIVYALPFGVIGRTASAAFVRRNLRQLFAYRHRVTAQDVAALHAQVGVSPMNVYVTGSTGLVGSALVPMLTTGGHSVTRLVRSRSEVGDAAAYWDPNSPELDPAMFQNCDAVVHLAGESVAAGRWTETKKARIRDSRVNGTRLLCETLARLDNPPKVLACASAVGFYGDRGDDTLTEDSRSGTGFLADVCHEWEAATAPAGDRGIRVVFLRTGMVLSPAGGALAKMLTPFKLGAGGVLGNGRQYMSWIAIDDVAGLIIHALTHEELSGPMNVTAPNPVTNREFTKTLGRVLGRPTIVPMPAFAARLAFGEMANALLLSSAKVLPERARQTGYEFRFTDLEDCLRHLLGR